MTQRILQEERRLWKRGYKWVAGLDEVGRGSLAGPVVAAAVALNSKFKTQNPKLFQTDCFATIRDRRRKIQNLKDSKKLSPQKREKFYRILTKHPSIKWGIGRVSEKVIDKINILEATKLAMKKAIKNLEKKYCAADFVNFLIIDGNFNINLPIPQKSIIKADEKVFSCAVASIFAKVFRDRIMKKIHQRYPLYGFDRNKGYPTKEHFKNIQKYGLCKIHRMSFNHVF